MQAAMGTRIGCNGTKEGQSCLERADTEGSQERETSEDEDRQTEPMERHLGPVQPRK